MLCRSQTARSDIYTINPCTWAIMHLCPRADALWHKCDMCTRALRALEHILILCPLRAHKMLYGPRGGGLISALASAPWLFCEPLARRARGEQNSHGPKGRGWARRAGRGPKGRSAGARKALEKFSPEELASVHYMFIERFSKIVIFGCLKKYVPDTIELSNFAHLFMYPIRLCKQNFRMFA